MGNEKKYFDKAKNIVSKFGYEAFLCSYECNGIKLETAYEQGPKAGLKKNRSKCRIQTTHLKYEYIPV